jgi:hypothetical protein
MAIPEVGLGRKLYTGLFRRNAVFVGVLMTTAFAFEVVYDKFTDSWWEKHNKGVR